MYQNNKLLKAANGSACRKTSALLLASLVLFTLSFTFVGVVEGALAPHIGEIRITPEGTVEGTNSINRNGDIYILTADIKGTAQNGATFISIEKDGVTLDGAGHTLSGTGTGVAVTAYGRIDITIKNLRIVNFGTGIELRARYFEINSTASNNQILDNYLENEYWGIDLNTLNGKVAGNTIVVKKGIYGVNFQSNDTTFTDNAFTNGGLAVFNQGVGNVFSGNTINGKPLIYLYGQSNQVVDGASQVILVNCDSMDIRNVKDTVDLRQTIQLYETTNTKITNCRGNIALIDSDSNIITQNSLTETGSMANYDAAAIALTNSNNNTITQNTVTANNCNGITLAGSAYNNIEENRIIATGSGSAQSAIRVETSPQALGYYNYIHGNILTSEDNGIYLRSGAGNNSIFGNVINNCENGIMMGSARNNMIYANNITGSTQNAIYLSISDYNSFYHNNFVANAKQAQENHQVYWWAIQNYTYYSENNKWDNGNEGNYWSDYIGADINGDGIGETPYTVYENFIDHYPLTAPFNIGNVQVDYEEWIAPPEPLRIWILSPQNVTYNATSIALNLTVSQPTSWLAYSMDSQPNMTITGNTTLASLPQGAHTITVYGNTTQGATAASDILSFYVDAPESYPLVPIVVGSAAIVGVAATLGLLLHRKKQSIT